MTATILDTQTGLRADLSGPSAYDFAEGNFACDCNRNLWDPDGEASQTCVGCHRFIVVAVALLDTDDEARGYTLAELNAFYPPALLQAHGVTEITRVFRTPQCNGNMSDELPHWDIDKRTGEAREWRLVAKEDIEGQEWTFPKGKKLRGFKDYRTGDWCVYQAGDYYNSRIFGVPESLLIIAGTA